MYNNLIFRHAVLKFKECLFLLLSARAWAPCEPKRRVFHSSFVINDVLSKVAFSNPRCCRFVVLKTPLCCFWATTHGERIQVWKTVKDLHKSGSPALETSACVTSNEDRNRKSEKAAFTIGSKIETRSSNRIGIGNLKKQSSQSDQKSELTIPIGSESEIVSSSLHSKSRIRNRKIARSELQNQFVSKTNPNPNSEKEIQNRSEVFQSFGALRLRELWIKVWKVF